MKNSKAGSIDEYIKGFPKDIQKMLNEIRAAIRKAAPEAEEAIKYDMPAFTLKGNLVYFAAYRKHIGFYGAPTEDPAFKKEFSAYKTGRGSVQFPLDKPMPLNLISRIVKFRVNRDLKKEKEKSKKKTAGKKIK